MINAFAARSIARSHIGSVREINEDRILNLVERGLWAVADGMGGHAMGDVAAQTVVSTLAEFATDTLSPTRLEAALVEANRRVLGLHERSGRQCGSTVAGLGLTGRDTIVFWAGDSRVYRLRKGEIALLTRDHRVVQDMVDAGMINADQARRHPRATVITRAVGAGVRLDLALQVAPAARGDTYLICSDGLSDLVEDRLLVQALACPDDASADCLVGAALEAGGTDNISFVIVALDAQHASADDDGATIIGVADPHAA